MAQSLRPSPQKGSADTLFHVLEELTYVKMQPPLTLHLPPFPSMDAFDQSLLALPSTACTPAFYVVRSTFTALWNLLFVELPVV